MTAAVHVIAALPGEARTLARRGLAVSVCGVGAEAARRAAERVLAQGSGVILSWGVAGGLDPGLEAGDLFLPRHVSNGRGGLWPAAGREGTLLTVAEPVTDAADKARLWRNTGCHAVDMESAAVAEVCAAHGAVFVSVRAIADPAARSVPSWMPALLDDNGRPRLGRLAARLLAERGAVTAVRGCMADYRAALGALRAAAADLTGLIGAPA